MSKDFLFTSESVSEGHPDKICDQISDAILDKIIHEDSNARVACEAAVKDNQVFVLGEMKMKSSAPIDYATIVRETIRNIGYTNEDLGFCADSCKITCLLGEQSQDIGQGVDRKAKADQGAGDQGLMFGYATDETDHYMPAPIDYAHRLMKKHAAVRKNGKISWLRPDAKSQLTFQYKNHRPVAIKTVVLSTQHAPDINNKEIEEAVKEEIIFPVLPKEWLSNDTKYYINPTGRFEIGGPKGDCGLTGRKIIIDTYGGMARHGGGAFSGKDPSKVDRSATYMARYVAKNIVMAGLAKRCEIQLSYAIGVAEPVSILIETFGTGVLNDDRLSEIVKQNFILTPYGIIKTLSLDRPKFLYQDTAVYGHFGRDEFPWEKGDKCSVLSSYIK